MMPSSSGGDAPSNTGAKGDENVAGAASNYSNSPSAAPDSNNNNGNHDNDNNDICAGSAGSKKQRLGLPCLPLFFHAHGKIQSAREYSRRTKHVATGIVAACAVATPLGSNIFLPVLSPAAKDLHTTPTVMNLSIAFYCLAVAITPLWWTTLSEQTGTRTTYASSFVLFVIFNILAAVSSSAGMFITMRLLAGAAAAPVQALGAATVAQLWDLAERGRATGIFLLGAMCGTVFGPVLGGALGSRWGWQGTQWFMAFYGVLVWLAVVLFLPETEPAKLAAMAAGPEAAATNPEAPTPTPTWSMRAARLLTAIVSPAKLIALLRFLPIAITVLYAAVTFAAYYCVMIAVQATFSTAPYNYSVIIVGLLYLPNAAGYVLAGTLGGRWNDATRARRAATRTGPDDNNCPPESTEKPRTGAKTNTKTASSRGNTEPGDMLGLNVWSAALLYPAAALGSGWAMNQHGPWESICAANFIFAWGNMMILSVTTVLLTEFVPGRPSVGMALSNLVRNTLGAAACVAVQPLLDTIGAGWLFFIVAIISGGVGIASAWVLRKHGARWRDEMTEKLRAK